ncbi:alpha/beta hydrolase [Flavobacterium luminosum]|uniref:Alpha/beta hydrolase n=1 Tax=Flavobacterium luminosum TaxID=2949086 RepID=A0ABT0TJW9_9FLAO|nr:alpha/beta hydrolase [Flavobacterium sp. HXWNR70]MCL9807798.1 alpha/beta hydrolase [Flavobacterium sp. HXWNR70]
MSKIHVYFMPGMAASSLIFEKIELPSTDFEKHMLDWVMPEKKETLLHYAERMAKEVKHENAVLVGVSFGGILVQEMKRFLNPRKIIIISSVKSNQELPIHMKIAKATKAYKLLPTSLAQNIDALAKYAFGTEIVKQRLEMYKVFMTRREKEYLDWSIEQIINWERATVDPEVVHIHGDADEVFPVKYIKNYINVKGGTHVMIITRYRRLNTLLPKIILGENVND